MKNSNIVVTNLRINKHDWLDIKVRAAERGMSVNQYINYLLDKISLLEELGFLERKRSPRKRKKHSFWDLPETLKNVKLGPAQEASEDDKIIYGLDD